MVRYILCLLSQVCLTSLCLSHVSSLSHVSFLSHVDCVSHVSCLSHIFCHTSPAQEGRDWPAAAYQWDAKKLYRFDLYQYWYFYSGFGGLMKPISGLRQFICFGNLNGLCGLKYNFADMRFSGPRLNPLTAACRYIDHQHIFWKLHAIPTVDDVSFSPLGNRSWVPLPTPPQHEHLIYDEFVQPQPLKKAKTLKRGSNGGGCKKKSLKR